MKLILQIITACFCAFIFIACTSGVSSKANVVKKRYAQYGVGLLPEHWVRKSFRDADLFFQHNVDDAMIFLNSQCERLSDSPLEALTSQMLGGMGKYDVTSEQRIPLSDREALLSEVNVKLDGVDRFLKIMVLRKNRCVFDAVLSSRVRRDDLIKDFDAMIQSFYAEAEL